MEIYAHAGRIREACAALVSRIPAIRSMNTYRVQIIAGSAILALAVAAVALPGIGKGSKAAGQAPPSPAQTRAIPNGRNPGSAPVAALDAADIPQTIAPLPANATVVPDEDLLKLSGLVRLANARYAHPDKERWSRAIPVAQQLLAGPCDCEQRNWLNHFVAMGNDAITNLDQQYHEEAQLLATLGRNDQDAMARRRQQQAN